MTAVPKLPEPNVSRHGKVTALSMMKDEAPFLLEWVAHHLAVGFTDLVVYTNDCIDGTDEMLIRLQDLGLAQHRRNAIAPGSKPQPSALNLAQDDLAVTDSDWLLILDADEFLSIRHADGSLDRLIDAIEAAEAQGIVITWRIFGSGGVQHWSRDFVTEQYLMAAPPMWNKGWGVKTLFRYDPEIWKLGIHRPKFRNKVLDTDRPGRIRWLNGSGRAMEDYFKFRGWRSILRTVGYDWAQMNHYAVKSIDSYALRRLRGNVNNKADKYDADYWALQDRNEVRDDTMLRYSQRRRAIFEGLLCDPVLSRLHHAALDGIEARLTEIKRGPEYDALVARLRAASAVPITEVSAKPPQARDPARIAALMSAVEARVGETRQREKARPPEDRALAPTPTLVRGAVDIAAAAPVKWFANHSLRLPADPRLFTPPALISIAAGKFDRNLARNLPGLLPEGSAMVEIGAGCGFLSGHIARTRPDVVLSLHEADPGWRAALRWIWAENGLDPVGRLADDRRADDSAPLVQDVRNLRPQVLLLGDPQLVPDDLAELCTPPPRVLILAGRLWPEAFAALAGFEAALKALGCTARLPLDPAICCGWTLEPEGAP